MLNGKKILLVVSGGISAYKSPELIRSLKKLGATVRCVLTSSGAEFVTALALGAVSEGTVYQNLLSLTDEAEMGHIRLSREADVVLVAPATANIMAKMAAGIADDLATTTLLATDKTVICAPAMNVQMWNSSATKNNMETLINRGIRFIGPEEGEMACGEWGMGRMSEPEQIITALDNFFCSGLLLNGTKTLITSGPTHEAIDPVRYLANRSSGKQGHNIAIALAQLGSKTTLVSGPTNQPDPAGVEIIKVESAIQMFEACMDALPADIAVLAAAVSDWRPKNTPQIKIKKVHGQNPPNILLEENPDILSHLSKHGNLRPQLVVGFAAETENVIENAISKRKRKGCDWIIANDVSPEAGTFSSNTNTVHLITEDGVENWPRCSKAAVAERLASNIAKALEVAV
jgi:phosphopantothenoylcysteine decarboxylase/phosphopantothenate--cysteine ligase